MSTGRALALTGLAALAACGRGDRSRDVGLTDSLSHELEIAPMDTDTAAAAPIRPKKTRSGATPAARQRTTTTKPPAAPVRRSHPKQPKASSPSDSVAPVESATVHGSGGTVPDSTPAAGIVTDSGRTSDPASAPAPAMPTPAPSAAMRAVPAGTQIRALLQDSIHSLGNSEGQTVTAFISGDLRASDGRTVVPSGSAVTLSITRLRPARSRSAKDGELELRADSITVAGHAYPVSAQVQPVPHELKGRGVTAGEAEKVAAGTAVGAVAGGVITGKTRGAVIGGAIGAAGGAVVAAQTASRDVVVPRNTPLVLILTAPLEGSGR
jgi:hypothetical protein